MRSATVALLASQTPAAALNAQKGVKLPAGKKSFQVDIQTTAVILLQASNDDVTYYTMATFTNAAGSGLTEIDSAIPFWRVNNSSWGAGSIGATVGYVPNQDA